MERIAGITSNTVPWEILRAAGYSPCLLEDEPGSTPYADRFMEKVFERRIRVIFDRLCAGAWSRLEVVAIPRTSEQEHKLFLYLREACRLRYSPSVPRLYLYNILHTQTSDSYRFGLERTRQMARDFAASESGLGDAITESNRARAAVRQILQAREEGRLEGSLALEMIKGFYLQNRGQFADAVPPQLRNLPLVHPVSRPRILIKGVSLNHTALHRLIEQCGGYVVAEDDWRGSRAAGDRDVPTDGDPVMAIFEKYFYDTASPRVHPSGKRDAWFRRQIERRLADGVIFYIPLEDDVLGWDYPPHLAYLQSREVPSLLLRESGAPEPSPELAGRISGFVEGLLRG